MEYTTLFSFGCCLVISIGSCLLFVLAAETCARVYSKTAVEADPAMTQP